MTTTKLKPAIRAFDMPNRLPNGRFKPGFSGNPKGPPRRPLTKQQRLLLLAEIALMNKHKGNPVEAIREQNRMEGIYPPIQHQVAQKVVFEVRFIERRQVEEVSPILLEAPLAEVEEDEI